MFVAKEDHNEGKPVVDLTSSAGNAFVLLGLAESWAKQCGYTAEEHKKLDDDLTSGDYEHLVSVLDEHFGSMVIFLR